MSRLSQDVVQVQNPALGAFLQWRYAVGYTTARGDGSGSPLVLAFLVLPMLFLEDSRNLLESTNRPSGLRAFATKFGESKISKTDILLGLHDRVRDMRALSLESLRMALAYRLVSVDADGAFSPLSRTSPRALIPTNVRLLMRNAEKLGGWSAELTLFEISSILKVQF